MPVANDVNKSPTNSKPSDRSRPIAIQVTGNVKDDSGRGISGVLVSNGEHVLETDADGHYEIQVEPGAHSFLFVTVPSGFRARDNFCHPVSDGSDAVEFVLEPEPPRAQRRFSLAHITDTHVVVEEVAMKWGAVMAGDSGEILAQDLMQLVDEVSPDLIIASGDLTNMGTLSELRSFRKAIQCIQTPVIPVFGGHDGNEERFAGETGGTFTRNYEQVLGPIYYSFDLGERHFVLYAQEDYFFSEADQRRKERWLWEDLALQPKEREIVLVMHTPPRRAFLEQLAAFNVTLLLHGHWHSSKVFTYGRITVAAAPPLGFGGMDTSSRGYRLARFVEDGLELELDELGRTSSPNIEESKEVASGKAQTPLTLVWEQELPVGLHRAEPIHSGPDLLLSLQDEDHRGRAGVYCVDVDTGKKKWQVRTDSSVKNSVAVEVMGRCVAVSVTGQLYCLDSKSGKVLWRAELPGYPDRWIYTSPAIADETVYVGAKSGYGSYDLRTGTQQWYTAFEGVADLADPIGDNWPCYAGPQVYEELLFVLVPRRGLLALSRDDGGTIWEQQLGVEYHYAVPVLAGHLLVTGGDIGKLAVLDARSGEVVWHLPVLEAGYPSGLTVEDGRIYATTPEGQVRCCDLLTGELRWKFQCGNDLLDMIPYRRGIRSILAKPIVYRDLVIICGCDGGMYMLDALSGECKSRMRFDAPATAPPSLVEDGFCVGTRDGRLYRFAG